MDLRNKVIIGLILAFCLYLVVAKIKNQGCFVAFQTLHIVQISGLQSHQHINPNYSLHADLCADKYLLL